MSFRLFQNSIYCPKINFKQIVHKNQNRDMRPADLNSQGSSINHLVWNWSQFFASQSTTATQIGWTGLKDSSNKSSVKTSHPKFGMQMGKTWQKYNARRRLDNILQHHKKSSNQIRHGIKTNSGTLTKKAKTLW